jgi:hypothetical protein
MGVMSSPCGDPGVGIQGAEPDKRLPADQDGGDYGEVVDVSFWSINPSWRIK